MKSFEFAFEINWPLESPNLALAAVLFVYDKLYRAFQSCEKINKKIVNRINLKMDSEGHSEGQEEPNPNRRRELRRKISGNEFNAEKERKISESDSDPYRKPRSV